MKLTWRTEYALLAMVTIARAAEGAFVPADQIAKDHGIPQRFLEQILFSLKRGGYLRSMKGQHGGYALARPASRITLAELLRFLGGALAPTESVSQFFYQATPVAREPSLLAVFREIRDYAARRLEETTLADVVARRAVGRRPTRKRKTQQKGVQI